MLHRPVKEVDLTADTQFFLLLHLSKEYVLVLLDLITVVVITESKCHLRSCISMLWEKLIRAVRHGHKQYAFFLQVPALCSSHSNMSGGVRGKLGPGKQASKNRNIINNNIVHIFELSTH